MAGERKQDEEIPRTTHPQSSLRLRARPLQPVRSAPFAGRIGGNQGFVALGDDEASEAILEKQPDAVRTGEILFNRAMAYSRNRLPASALRTG